MDPFLRFVATDDSVEERMKRDVGGMEENEKMVRKEGEVVQGQRGRGLR